jgi:hypothetical protein
MFDLSFKVEHSIAYKLVYYAEIFNIRFSFNGQYIQIAHPGEVTFSVSHGEHKTAGFVVRESVSSVFDWIQYVVETKRNAQRIETQEILKRYLVDDIIRVVGGYI